MRLATPTRVYEAVYRKDGRPRRAVTIDRYPSSPTGVPEWHVWLEHYEPSPIPSDADSEGGCWVGDELEIHKTKAFAVATAKQWGEDLEGDGCVRQ